MQARKFTATATGDSLFVAPFPPEYAPMLDRVASFIRSCDARLTNLETNLSDFEFFGNAYSGGTWLNTRRELLPQLFRYGFNFFGNANNHAMDYSYNGLLSTIDTLDAHHVAHAGTGRSLEEAAAPAFLCENGTKFAVFAVDASAENPSRAGRATKKFPPRPGVNYLRHKTVYKVTETELAQLRAIAEHTRINYAHERLVATGYHTPDPEGSFTFGGQLYTTRTDVPETTCDPGDKARLLEAIRKAKSECDCVFILVHCHDNDNVREENPPEYYKEFARACIDAGVSAVFGGGCHRMRGIEIHNGAPIFYSLGDFIYQGPRVEYLPADFMEKYGVDIFATAEEALLARSRGNTIGLHCNKLNYQTVLPKLTFENGRMIDFRLLPVYLNFDRKDHLNGLPDAAVGREAAEILDLLNELSSPYGVQLKEENGLFTLA